MPHLTLDTPLYPIRCPKCNKEQLLSFFAMTTPVETVVRCQGPRCYESIRLVDHYKREDLEPIAEALGIEWFASVHDSFDTPEHRKGFLQGAREEQIEMGMLD